MQSENHIIHLDDTTDEFLFTQNDIFNRVKEILTSNEIYFDIDKSNKEISCICGILPSQEVIKIIHDNINSPIIIFDSLIIMIENDGKLFIRKK